MRIAIISSVDADTVRRLRERHEIVYEVNPAPDRLLELVGNCHVLVFRSGVDITREVIDSAKDLKLLIRAGSGVDNVDLEHAGQQGIAFERIPEPAAWAVSELTFALMLGLARKLIWANETMRNGQWRKRDYNGILLYKKTLGILGVGNIGTRVGRLGVALGMDVVGCVENPSPGRERSFAGMGISLTDFDDVVRRADILTIHLPLKESTRHIVDMTALSSMKDGSYLLNLARGGIVDEQALTELMQNGTKFAGLGFDVHAVEKDGHTSALASFPNVILTPHVGSQIAECQSEVGLRIYDIIENLDRTGLAPWGGRGPGAVS